MRQRTLAVSQDSCGADELNPPALAGGLGKRQHMLALPAPKRQSSLAETENRQHTLAEWR
ncbi:MAG TPA: hypothetical protein VIK75_07850 [Calditerricola sp.]